MLVCLFFLRLSARCAWSGSVSGALLCLFTWGLTVGRLNVGYFQEERGAVKGERHNLSGEGVLMCVDHVLRVADTWLNVERSVSITEEQVSRAFINLTETRDFYSADIPRGSRSSTESVVCSRATHYLEHHGERRGGVKGILFSPRVIWPRVTWSGELQGGGAVCQVMEDSQSGTRGD